MQKDRDFYIRLGWALRIRRKSKKIPAANMAKIIGVSYQQICKYEAGKDRIPVDRLDTLCQELKIDTDWILNWAKNVKIIE